MSTSNLHNQSPDHSSPSLYTSYERAVEAKWYALYSKAHHENHVAQQLLGRSLEVLFPVYSSMRRWKDRRVQLSLPLFPGYLFVRLGLENRMLALTVPGVVSLVGSGSHPVAIPSEEIEALRHLMTSKVPMEPHPYLACGRRVRVKHGPFAGMEGILLRKKHDFRLVLSVTLINRSVAIELDAADVMASN